MFPAALQLSCTQALLSSNQSFWGLIFPCMTPGWGSQCGAWASHSFGRASAIVIILLLVGCPPRGGGLDSTVFLLSYSSSVVPSLYLWLVVFSLASCLSYMCSVYVGVRSLRALRSPSMGGMEGELLLSGVLPLFLIPT